MWKSYLHFSLKVSDLYLYFGTYILTIIDLFIHIIPSIIWQTLWGGEGISDVALISIVSSEVTWASQVARVVSNPPANVGVKVKVAQSCLTL